MSGADRVQVGQRVKIRARFDEAQVLRVHEHGIEGHIVFAGGSLGSNVRFWLWQDIELPEPPKAEPGVVYRYIGNAAGCGSTYFGMADGRLLCAEVSPSVKVPINFDPDKFVRVEPQP